MSDTVLHVKIAEFRVAAAPAVFRIAGLGSCVALALYDQAGKRGGMAHILLPGPAPAAGAEEWSGSNNPHKYADRAIAALVQAMRDQGSRIEDLVAKIAGGANMFSTADGFDKFSPVKPRVGERNVEAVKKHLESLAVPLRGEDIGGGVGRNVTFDLATGDLIIADSRGNTIRL